jgi:hypothetical protein
MSKSARSATARSTSTASRWGNRSNRAPCRVAAWMLAATPCPSTSPPCAISPSSPESPSPTRRSRRSRPN